MHIIIGRYTLPRDENLEIVLRGHQFSGLASTPTNVQCMGAFGTSLSAACPHMHMLPQLQSYSTLCTCNVLEGLHCNDTHFGGYLCTMKLDN